MSTGRRTGGLRFRVTALASVAVLVVLAVAGVALVEIQRAILVDGLEQSISDRADALAARMAAGEQVSSGSLPVDDVLVQVVDGAGRVIAASPGLGGPSLGLAPPGTTVSGGELPGGQPARVLARRAP